MCEHADGILRRKYLSPTESRFSPVKIEVMTGQTVVKSGFHGWSSLVKSLIIVRKKWPGERFYESTSAVWSRI